MDDTTVEEMTEEELAWQAGVEQGVLTPYTPGTTQRKSLEEFVPGVAMSSAPIAIVETIQNRMRVLANQHGPHPLTKAEHIMRFNKSGTMYHGEEKGKIFEEDEMLSKDDRKAIMQTMVAGQYVGPKPPVKEDVLGVIETYTKLNETYLPHDSQALMAKVRSLLPAAKVAQPAKGKQAAKK